MKSIKKFSNKKIENMSCLQGGNTGSAATIQPAGVRGSTSLGSETVRDKWDLDSKGKVINLETRVGAFDGPSD